MNGHFSGDLPKGIQKITMLPDGDFGELWESIYVEEGVKDRLLSHAVLNFTVRPKVKRSVLPLHGVILLVGLPGTGKTSLAKGLANRTSKAFKSVNMQVVEVDAHNLTSSAMGKTQRAVSNLFSQTLAELAGDDPTIVLLDEVETLAVDRAQLSLDANPIDIHRATDAVLVQLDLLAESHKNLLFIATSNYPQAVDDAFISRCDLVLDVPLPNKTACRKILSQCLAGLGTTYPEISALVSKAGFETCAASFVGLDGRTIRKTVANALASNTQIAMSPGSLSLEHLIDAANAAQNTKSKKGTCNGNRRAKNVS